MIALLIVTLIASSTSVNNPYDRFGSKFSSTSANNPYAVDTPQLVEKKGDVCPVSRKCPSNSSICKSRRQSANKFDPDSINNRYDFQYGPILRDLIEAGHVQNARQRGQETLDGCIEVQIPSRTMKNFYWQYGPILHGLIEAGHVQKIGQFATCLKRCCTYRFRSLEASP